MRRLRVWLVALMFLLLGTSAVQGAPLNQPVRLSHVTIPAILAFKSHDALWLMDGRNPDAQPQRITKGGFVELVDWSADGKWFAFLRYPHELGLSEARLWVVRADGSQMKQVDSAAIQGTPQWSPAENRIVFQTWNAAGDGDGLGKIATIRSDGTVEVRSLWEASEHLTDFAWEPSGKCLAMALPRTTAQPLRIDRLCLNGLRSNLWTDPGLAPEKLGSIYVRDARGLKFSPNGRYLSYFLFVNSGSISADGVAIRVLDVNTRKAREIGGGLGYRDWLAWSPDSSTLAFIAGGNRMVTYDKHLTLYHPQSGILEKLGQRGLVDTAPVYSQKRPYRLFFQRGMETHWHTSDPTDLVVPGQRIWQRLPGGELQAATIDKAGSADYLPQVTPDGKSLLFLRLTTFQKGSLYWKGKLSDLEATEVVRGIFGRDHGYYGNYLPPWVKVYWKISGPVSAPGLFCVLTHLLYADKVSM